MHFIGCLVSIFIATCTSSGGVTKSFLENQLMHWGGEVLRNVIGDISVPHVYWYSKIMLCNAWQLAMHLLCWVRWIPLFTLVHGLPLDMQSILADSPRAHSQLPSSNTSQGRSQHSEEDVFDFWPYQWLHHLQADLPYLSTFIKVGLLFIVIMQLPFVMPIIAFKVHHSADQHSCISLDKWLFMYAAVFLYIFTRGLLPLITFWVFFSAVINKLGTESSSLASDFLKEVSRKENEFVFRAAVRIFWDERLAEKKDIDPGTVAQHLKKKFSVMCVTSLSQAIVITLMLVQVGATRFVLDAYSFSFGKVLEGLIVCADALFYFALILTIGIIASFFYHEATVNYLAAGTVALEDHADSFGVKPSQELIKLAKNAVNNFNNRWSTGEIFIFLSVQVYTLIPLLFAGAGLPLSCGITAHIHTEQMYVHWLAFVIFFSMSHFLSTCVWPSSFDSASIRSAGIALEVALLIVLCIVQPPLFGTFLQILFVVMPSAYLYWYLWTKAHFEYFMYAAKPKEWRQQHQRNMAIYICLMAQLVVAIIVSIISEVSILSSSPTSCERSTCNTQTDQCSIWSF